MNQEIKARWIAALRSGKYEQGRLKLRRADDDGDVRYCCLGVLCELAVDDGVCERNGDIYDGCLQILPVKVTDWAGLQDQNPNVDYHDGTPSLAECNDGWELTFSQIADLIESQL